LLTAEGKEYLEESIKNFEKDKIFTYSSIFIIEFMLLWLLLGFMLMIHYTNKVRHFILLEQQKAIHCVQSSFAATGIYAIYQELEGETLADPGGNCMLRRIGILPVIAHTLTSSVR
jgi:hypothetical protein